MTPRWQLDAELADAREHHRVRERARQRHHHERATAYQPDPARLARLLAATCDESLIDRHHHATQIALTVETLIRKAGGTQ